MPAQQSQLGPRGRLVRGALRPVADHEHRAVRAEAGEPLGDLGGSGGRHDWLVVTADAPDEEPEDEPDADEPDPDEPDEDESSEPESLDEADPEGSEAALDALSVEEPVASVPDEADGCVVGACVAVPAPVVVVACLVVAPSAGSCPVTKRPKIATQAARKSESVIAMTRRRMVRARCLRARTRWRARIRPSSGDVGGGVEIGVDVDQSGIERQPFDHAVAIAFEILIGA